MEIKITTHQNIQTSCGDYSGPIMLVQYLKINVVTHINRLMMKNLYGINGLRKSIGQKYGIYSF